MANHNTSTGDGSVSLGSQTWNSASEFSKIKILRLLVQIDIDEEIAMFGKRDDLEEVNYQDIPYRRRDAFDKFMFHLRQLIGNCKFSIEKGDENLVKTFVERIDSVERVFDGISNTMHNDVTKEDTLIINEKHFRKCFDILRSIKDELNFPVNRAGLIFKSGENLNIDDIMKTIEQGE